MHNSPLYISECHLASRVPQVLFLRVSSVLTRSKCDECQVLQHFITDKFTYREHQTTTPKTN